VRELIKSRELPYLLAEAFRENAFGPMNEIVVLVGAGVARLFGVSVGFPIVSWKQAFKKVFFFRKGLLAETATFCEI
jgi:hypothetical protein